jgi:hypothetical protein
VKKWAKWVATASAAILLIAGGRMSKTVKAVVDEGPKIARLGNAIVAVQGRVRGTPEGDELNAAFNDLWIMRHYGANPPPWLAATTKASPGTLPIPSSQSPMDLDSLRTKIAGGGGRP